MLNETDFHAQSGSAHRTSPKKRILSWPRATPAPQAMAETEAVTVVPAEAEEVSAAAAPAAEEEKEIPKPDMSAVKKPDEAEFNASIEAAQARLDGYHKRIQEIKESLDSRENLRNASSSETGQARARLNELRAQARALANERNAIYNSINEQEDLRKARNEKLTELKKAVGPHNSIEEIDEAIKKKEYAQQTESLPLNQVKKLMAEIKDMQASKPRVKEVHEINEMLKRDKEVQNVLYAKLKEKSAEMNAMRDLERKQAEEVDRIRKKEEGNRSDVPSLMKERDECKKGIGATREEMKKLRDEFNAAKKVYFDAQRLLKRWQLQERHKEWQAREADRAARRKEREAEEATRVPWEEEMALCDQLVTYVSRYVPASKPAGDAPNGTASAPTATVGGRKGKLEEDYFVGAKAKSKGKGKKVQEPGSLKVSHTPEVFASFDKLQLRPPLVAGECAAAIEQLKAKKEWFKTAPPKAELKKAEEAKRAAAAAAEEAAKKAEEEAAKAEQEMREAEAEERRAAKEAEDAAAKAKNGDSPAAKADAGQTKVRAGEGERARAA
jgi:uncharacterized coiled-coil DUF342 family protein